MPDRGVPFPPGKSGNPPGRPKGAKNKVTISVRQAMLQAFDKLGGVPGLAKWAKDNPTDFYRLWGRLLPVDVAGAFTIEPDVRTDSEKTGDQIVTARRLAFALRLGIEAEDNQEQA